MMISRLLTLLFVAQINMTFAQILKGQSYMLSDKIKSDCTVETGCDCCITDLFFLSDKEFVLIGNCEGGGSYFSGTYLKVNKKVTLTFKPFYVSQESDYLIENRKIEKKEIKINPMEFDLTTCGQKLETIENFKIKDRNG